MPTFDIVQYDATIPDGDDDIGEGVPILLADPFKQVSIPGEDGDEEPAGQPVLQLYSVPPKG